MFGRKVEKTFEQARTDLIVKKPHQTLDRIAESNAFLKGLTVQYYAVTVQSKYIGFVTEGWALVSDSNVPKQFAWRQQLQSGYLALINFWEVDKETFEVIRLNSDAHREITET